MHNSQPSRLFHFFLNLFFVFFTLCLYTTCTVQENLIEQGPSGFPLYLDDESTKSLIEAIDHHLGYIDSLPAKHQVNIGQLQFSTAALYDSLSSFRALVAREPDPLELGQYIRKNFHVFETTGRTGGGDILVTGYYEPLFEGRLNKKPPFVYPLYGIPTSLVTKQDEGKAIVGRLEKDDSIVPYWTRQEIETGDVLSGGELVYLRDPFDAYLLHVQGSGRIQLADGSIRAIRYGASNGLGYRSLGKLFVDQGIMTKDEVSIPRIRDHFSTHPKDMIVMLHKNPRYIFFRWGDEHGPRGSLGTILTPGRSIAIDHSALPTGALGYLVSNKPVLNEDGSIDHWRSFGRFVLPQDSGSAIQGPGRVDLFWGNDRYAEIAASHMNETGELFFLVKKNFELAEKIR